MAADDPVVIVDTNILFSALISRNTRFRDILFGAGQRFFICESVIVELFRHKEKLLRANPRLTPDEFAELYYAMLRRVEMFKEDWVPPQHWNEAIRLCREIDPDDVSHVAITLALDGVLWTGDGKLKRGLEARGFDRFFTPDQ